MQTETNLVDKLKEYFNKTPQFKIMEDWEATKEWDELEDEEIMLSELKARRDRMQLEIEMIDKELAKYEKK